MFKRRNAIVIFLVVAILLLGVGYAALVDTLQISAKATAATIASDPTEAPTGVDPSDPTTPQDIFDANVGFSACNTKDTGSTKYLDVKDTTDTEKYANLTDSVSFEASGFAVSGDKAVIEYTITNKHPDLDAVLDAVVVSPDSDTYFKAEATLDNGNTVTANGGTKKVTVTVTMHSTPSKTIQPVNFTLTYKVSTPADEG